MAMAAGGGNAGAGTRGTRDHQPVGDEALLGALLMDHLGRRRMLEAEQGGRVQVMSGGRCKPL